MEVNAIAGNIYVTQKKRKRLSEVVQAIWLIEKMNKKRDGMREEV